MSHHHSNVHRNEDQDVDLNDDNSPARSDDSNEQQQQANNQVVNPPMPPMPEYGTLSLDLDLDMGDDFDQPEDDEQLNEHDQYDQSNRQDQHSRLNLPAEHDDLHFPSLPTELHSHSTQHVSQQATLANNTIPNRNVQSVSQRNAANATIPIHLEPDATQVISQDRENVVNDQFPSVGTQVTVPITQSVASLSPLQTITEQAPVYQGAPASMPPLEPATRDTYGAHYDIELSIDFDTTNDTDAEGDDTTRPSLSHSLSLSGISPRGSQSRVMSQRLSGSSTSSASSLNPSQSSNMPVTQPNHVVQSVSRPPAPLFHAPVPAVRRESSIRSAALFLPPQPPSRSTAVPIISAGAHIPQIHNWADSQVYEDYPESPLQLPPRRSNAPAEKQQSPPHEQAPRSLSGVSVDFSDAFDIPDESTDHPENRNQQSLAVSPELNIAASPISTFASQSQDFPMISLHLSEEQDDAQGGSLYSNTPNDSREVNSTVPPSTTANADPFISHSSTPRRILPSVITGSKPVSPRPTPAKHQRNMSEETDAQPTELSPRPLYDPSDDKTFIRRRRLKRPVSDSDDDFSSQSVTAPPAKRARAVISRSKPALPQSSPIVVFDEGLTPSRRSPRIRSKVSQVTNSQSSQESQADDGRADKIHHNKRKPSSKSTIGSEESSNHLKSFSQTSLSVPSSVTRKRKRGHESTSSDEIENSDDDDFEIASPAASAKQSSRKPKREEPDSLMASLRSDSSSQSASKPSRKNSSASSTINPPSRSTQSKISEYMSLRSTSNSRSALNDISNNKADTAEPKWQSKKKTKTSPRAAPPMRSLATPRRSRKSAFTIASPASNAADVIEIDGDL